MNKLINFWASEQKSEEKRWILQFESEFPVKFPTSGQFPGRNKNEAERRLNRWEGRDG
jgi:hypothetical protein